jgi:saccharopine dehydrogenase (NAD+, L-lysine forming)
MRARILVVGGYGAVGRLLSRDLAAEAGIGLVIAGRNLAAAQRLAAELGAAARRSDLDDRVSWAAAIADIDLVVMCIDQGSTGFVALVLERGIRYADITAEDRLFRAIEAIKTPIRAAAMLSVGLAPGLTNLLAVRAAAELDSVETVEIGMLFGLGDEHGDAALAWLADKLFDPACERKPLRMDFGRDWGRRAAYPVDFSDRHALMRTRRFAAQTRMAFESRLTTALVFWLSATFAGSRLLRSLAFAGFRRLRLGSRTVNLNVVASGWKNGVRATTTMRFHAAGEAETTARLSTIQILGFLTDPPPPGIWHSHEILDPTSQFQAIEAAGVGRLDTGGPRRWRVEMPERRLRN